MAITKFKSMFTCYEFAAWLICLINFLERMISSSISIGKSYASGSSRLVRRLRLLSRDGQGAEGCPMWVMPTSSRMTDPDSTRTYPVRALQTYYSSHQGKSGASGSPKSIGQLGPLPRDGSPLIYARLLLLVLLSTPRSLSDA